MPLSEAELGFKNPAGNWSHDGAFSVETFNIEDVRNVTLPPSATIEGNIIRIPDGRIKQSVGAIQLYGGPNREHEFYFGYSKIICIRDGDGKLLWINYNL